MNVKSQLHWKLIKGYPNKKMIMEIVSNLDINIITDTDNINTMFCPSLDNSSDSCNRSIIQNYLKVLEFVKTNTILENKNKIKVYGETFGELLPKLSF